MKLFSLSSRRRNLLAAARMSLLGIALLSAIVGGGVAILLTRNSTTAHRPLVRSPLSESTRAMLQKLDRPIEIRFYSLLDPATTTAETQAFAERVAQLVSAYEVEAEGQLRVQRINAVSDPDAATAAAHDGLQAFNVHAGEACFLGITVSGGDRRETLPLLSPEWEPAVEADLSRAIARVAAPAESSRPSVADPTLRAASIEQVQRVIPSGDSVSLEDGKQQLRQAAVQELKKVSEETAMMMRDAQEKLARAQASGTDSEQQAALRELQQVQQSQMQKIKEISARSEAQIEAWEGLKTARQ
ncbi:MAG TPA: Gldg family protein [Verrucomicrobiae bacterium]|nr:Gldg family protein [Verrucomicrobiae bacterium]